MLERKRCREPHQLQWFSEAYEQATGYPVDLEYLKRVKTIGFCKDDKMIGGYVLNSNPPLRYDLTIAFPNELWDSMPDDAVNNTCEVACMFIARGAINDLERRKIYANLWRDVLSSPRKYVIWGSTRLALLYAFRRFARAKVYDNASALPGGANGVIYYTKIRPQVARMVAQQTADYALRRIGLVRTPKPVLSGHAMKDGVAPLPDANKDMNHRVQTAKVSGFQDQTGDVAVTKLSAPGTDNVMRARSGG